jgi:selenocysteine lyase/cysteine desulfurase
MNAANSKALVAPGAFPASHRSAYLNTASVCLVYAGAEKATTAWFSDLAEHGTSQFDEEAETAVFADLHAAAARLLNSRPTDIAAGSSATELIASIAWAIAPPQGTNIVAVEAVFPSTVYPWMRVARHTGAEMRWVGGSDAPVTDKGVIDAIDERTSVVALSHVEYRTGYRYDLGRLADAAHANDALLVVDASQSAGAIPIDVSSSGVDALIVGSYKWLCGPFGAAFMYLDPGLQATLEPGLVGFRSHRNMWDLEAQRIEFADDATRFEFSTMAYGCAVGLATAIDYLLGVGVETIFDWNTNLSDLLISGLDQLGADVISPRSGPERTSIVAARFVDTDVDGLVHALDEAGVVASARMGALRFSPHLYNTTDDINRALEVLRRADKAAG